MTPVAKGSRGGLWLGVVQDWRLEENPRGVHSTDHSGNGWKLKEAVRKQQTAATVELTDLGHRFGDKGKKKDGENRRVKERKVGWQF